MATGEPTSPASTDVFKERRLFLKHLMAPEKQACERAYELVYERAYEYISKHMSDRKF